MKIDNVKNLLVDDIKVDVVSIVVCLWVRIYIFLYFIID